RYVTEGGGFKLGVDLVGGTILIYKVDGDKMTEDQKRTFKVDELAARLKHRLDPNDLYNVTIRPVPAQKVEATRVEIILPSGGAHQEEIERRDWDKLLSEVKAQWPDVDEKELKKVPLGNRQQLYDVIQNQAKVSRDQAEEFVTAHYKVGTERKDWTSEQ